MLPYVDDPKETWTNSDNWGEHLRLNQLSFPSKFKILNDVTIYTLYIIGSILFNLNHKIDQIERFWNQKNIFSVRTAVIVAQRQPNLIRVLDQTPH